MRCGHGGGTANATHDHCGACGAAPDTFTNGETSGQTRDKSPHEGIAGTSWFQCRCSVDAGFNRFIGCECDGAFRTHLVDDKLSRTGGMRFGAGQSVTTLGKNCKFIVIAYNDVAGICCIPAYFSSFAFIAP